MSQISTIKIIFAKANFGYLRLNLDGSILEINHFLCSHLGYSASELIGQNFSKLSPKPDAVFTIENQSEPALGHDSKCDPVEIVLLSHALLPFTYLASFYAKDDVSISLILQDISSYKHTEKALTERVGFLEVVGNNSQDAIIMINAEGLVTGWSKRAETIFGWLKSEAIDKPLGELIVPERYRHAHNMGMQRYLSTNSSNIISQRIEITGLHKDGHEIPVELTINEIMYEGKPQFSAFVRDISRRKKIQHSEQSRTYVLELLAKGASLQTTLLAIIQGAESINPKIKTSIILLDRDGQRLVHGIGPKLPDFYHEAVDGLQIGPTVGCCGAAAFLGERVIVEDIQSHPNWKSFKEVAKRAELASCWSQPILNSQGKVIGTFAVYHDYITSPSDEDLNLIEQCASIASIAIERHQATQQLELLETSISHLNDIVLITEADHDGINGPKILFVNDAFERITGYTKQEVINQTPRILQGAKTQRSELDRIKAALSKWEPVRAEVLNYKKSGEEIWLELEIVPIKDSKGWCTHWVAVERDITDRKNSESAIKHLAFYDTLTDLPNRTLLIERLQRAIVATARSDQNGALIFIDLDNFKTLNDTQGHDVGDELLRQVALRLSNCVREIDTVARLGGDEFVILLAELSKESFEAASMAKNIGEKILAKFTEPFTLKKYEYTSSPSIGITLFNKELNSIELLLKRADLAMYQAKAAGKNMMRFFDPEMQEEVSLKATMESSLRKSIDKNQFVLYYQAQVDISCQILGFEVLIRWNHPKLGIVSPNEFIALAEETGLIIPLGMWAIRHACLQLAKWKESSQHENYYIAVNVSAKQFRHPEFINDVLSIVNETGIDPTKLKFELTESVLIANVEETITKMTVLKSIGIGFSLDDFGTGYSSLSYLKRLPLDQLKIDRSFVRDIMIDINDAIIIRTIIALGNSMGLNVIAEGVETQAQQEFLANVGCYIYQGYLYSRPKPFEELEAFINQINQVNQVQESGEDF